MRPRPPTGYTNADLLLATVVGFSLGLLIGAAALALLSPLWPKQAWLAQAAALLSLCGSGAPGVSLGRARVAGRKQRYAAHRVAALDERHCPACDYDLRGTAEPRRPECGERFSRREWSRVIRNPVARV